MREWSSFLLDWTADNITDKKDKTSSVLNSKTKSLLGELYNNQGKLSEINKTADLGKNMTKTPEVSL